MSNALPFSFPTLSFHACMRQIKATMPVPPFVLQVGAMDGVRFDLLHPHLSLGGWRGLLVEPMPDMFELLKKNYAGLTGLDFANCAIADFDGELTLHRVDPQLIADGKVREELLGTTSAHEHFCVLNETGSDELTASNLHAHHLQHITVPCLTLAHLLEHHNVSSIQIAVIDVEGADWMVARQLDLKRYRPSLLCIEYNNFRGDDMRECCAHFIAHGYKFALCEEDQQNLLFFQAAPA